MSNGGDDVGSAEATAIAFQVRLDPKIKSLIRLDRQTGQPVAVPLKAGEVVLLHNDLLHASDVNKSDISRRAFSVCYTETDVHTDQVKYFNVLFGKNALTPAQVKVEYAGAGAS